MSTCATQSDLDRLASLNFTISQFVDLFTALITFSASFFALKLLLFHSIFENSTKLLLILNLFYAIIYQIFYSIESTTVVYKHFNLEHEQCEILKPEKSCASINQILLGCSSGMIFCQTGLILERTIATFYKDYCRHKYLISSLINLIILIMSSQTGRLIYWDDPLNATSLACFVFPKQSAQRSLIYFLCCTVVTMFNLMASIWLKRYNKKLEYQIRFKIAARFHKREVIESTGTICFLNFSQFSLLFVYSVGISTMKSIRNVILPETYYFFTAWFYTIPFVAMIYPLLLIYRIRATKSKRIQKSIEISNRIVTQDDHINQIKTMWK